MALFSTKKIHEAKLDRLQQATKASFHIQSRGLSSHIYHMKPLIKFLRACIIPVLTYAVPVWGPGCPATGWEKLEPLQNRYLKRKLRVPDGTSTAILLAETGLYPLEIIALQQTLAFYQQVYNMPNDRLLKQALQMSMQDSERTGHTWFCQLRVWLDRWQLGDHDITTLGEEVIAEQYKNITWGGPLTAMPADQRRYMVFLRPHLLAETWQAQAHLEASIPHAQMQSIAQFRLRAAKFWVNLDRSIDREIRHCKRCSTKDLDDERHAFFYCAASRAIRAAHASFFEQVLTVQQLHQAAPKDFGPVALDMVRLLDTHCMDATQPQE